MNCNGDCKNVNTCCDKCYNDYLEWKKKESQILSAESYFDEKAYLLGQNATEEEKNPFLKNTNSWYNWNRGKNENLIDNLTKN